MKQVQCLLLKETDPIKKYPIKKHQEASVFTDIYKANEIRDNKLSELKRKKRRIEPKALRFTYSRRVKRVLRKH